MATPHMRWTLSAGWIAAAALAFLAIDASSLRSWMYLVTVALVPPMVLISLWPEPQHQTIRDLMHGAGGRS
jgi:hypothetical protein